MSNRAYSLSGYGAMISDHIRMDEFARALRLVVHPGAVVMDIGTGPGVMAVLACDLGASRVYAIEPSEIIQVAREVAAANQCAGKIDFFEDFSTNVTVPVRADVIVSDMRGILPLFEGHIPAIVDARRRFLAPGGTLIARKDRIWVAVVEAPGPYGDIVDPWNRNAFKQNLAVVRQKALNDIHKTNVSPDQLLTAPELLVTLDYSTIENPDVRKTLHWTTGRSGVGHGILAWFDTELADGVGFSNAPGAPEAIYGEAFFPWLEPVPLSAGQRVCVALEAKLLEKDYFWRWTTQIEPAEKSGESAVRFDQSQLQGAILSPAKLHKSSSDFIPRLSSDGLVRRRTLELMDGRTSLEGIARQLVEEFPQRFSHWHKALSYAGGISVEHSR